jgi:hypothetical protein
MLMLMSMLMLEYESCLYNRARGGEGLTMAFFFCMLLLRWLGVFLRWYGMNVQLLACRIYIFVGKRTMACRCCCAVCCCFCLPLFSCPLSWMESDEQWVGDERSMMDGRWDCRRDWLKKNKKKWKWSANRTSAKSRVDVDCIETQNENERGLAGGMNETPEEVEWKYYKIRIGWRWRPRERERKEKRSKENKTVTEIEWDVDAPIYAYT